MGVTFLVGCSYFVKKFRGLSFYVLLIGVGIAVALFPINDKLAFIILLKFLTKDMQKVNNLVNFCNLRNILFITIYFSVVYDNSVYGFNWDNSRNCRMANES